MIFLAAVAVKRPSTRRPRLWAGKLELINMLLKGYYWVLVHEARAGSTPATATRLELHIV